MEKLREAGSTEGSDLVVRLACIEALIESGELSEARQLAREARDVIMDSANRIEDLDYRERFLKCVSENAQTLRLAAELLDDP